MEVIIQQYGTYDDPAKVTEKRIICKTTRLAGDQYVFGIPDGSERREAALDNRDVAVVMADGTLKPLKQRPRPAKHCPQTPREYRLRCYRWRSGRGTGPATGSGRTVGPCCVHLGG